jgi:hypothetical protein
MKILTTVLLIFLFFVGATTHAQGDGPRAYWPQPNGTNMATPLYTFVGSNQVFDNSQFIKEADFNTNIYGLMYTRLFNVKGRTAAIVAMLSYGDTSGGLPGFNGTTNGLGDIYVVGVLNLYGAPSVNREEFMKTKYNTIVDVQLAFRAPTGKYDGSDVLNLGTNRWEFKLGAPFMKFINWGTPKVTSIELLPSISFFTKNNDLGTTPGSLSQKPLFALESHVTQQLNKMLWLSLDSMYRLGGETAVNDVDNDNAFNTFQLGGTLGMYFSRTVGLKLSYGSVVGETTDGMSGDMFRAMLSYTF